MICRLLLPPKHSSLTPLSRHATFTPPCHNGGGGSWTIVEAKTHVLGQTGQGLLIRIRYTIRLRYPESAVRARQASPVSLPFRPWNTFRLYFLAGRQAPFPGQAQGSHCPAPLRPFPGSVFYFTPQEFQISPSPRHGSSKSTLTDLTSNCLKFSPFKHQLSPLANVGRFNAVVSNRTNTVQSCMARLSTVLSYLRRQCQCQDLRTSKPWQMTEGATMITTRPGSWPLRSGVDGILISLAVAGQAAVQNR